MVCWNKWVQKCHFNALIGIAIGNQCIEIKLTTLGYKTIYARFKKLDRVNWFNQLNQELYHGFKNRIGAKLDLPSVPDFIHFDRFLVFFLDRTSGWFLVQSIKLVGLVFKTINRI